ncbi:MAG: polysaccharide pyruvyl transferase family protein [Bacilli bacterium]|nr:polysaccharide pyruvyl transferase family protein [Bacilli bacterium]MDD4733548.1 polysaccharide pyruvyl transferase family protein [Bacilli bacterium]
MKKIGIITFHCADNLGAVLQVYALQKKINKLGLESEVIDFKPLELLYPYGLKNLKDVKKRGFIKTIKSIVVLIIRRKVKNKRDVFKKFREKYLVISKQTYYESEDLNANPPQYDYYITGSDQVWNPDFFEKIGKSYFLDFASPSSTKISYAASITKKMDDSFNDVFKKNIDRFDFISIRESEHVRFLKNLTEKPITVALDPTLLLDKEDYNVLLSKSKIKEKYILVYDLEYNEELVKLANKISEEKGYKIVSYSDHKNYENRIKTFRYEGPSEFISYLENAEFVLTTSFHGVAFSVIFKKPFYTIPHKTRGTRMIDLLNSIGLEDRIVYNFDDLESINYELDYSKPFELLNKRREESSNFLITALDEKK